MGDGVAEWWESVVFAGAWEMLKGQCRQCFWHGERDGRWMDGRMDEWTAVLEVQWRGFCFASACLSTQHPAAQSKVRLAHPRNETGMQVRDIGWGRVGEAGARNTTNGKLLHSPGRVVHCSGAKTTASWMTGQVDRQDGQFCKLLRRKLLSGRGYGKQGGGGQGGGDRPQVTSERPNPSGAREAQVPPP